MGRYFDETTDPRTEVFNNLRRNIQQISSVMLQKKMMEQQRQQQMQDAVKKKIIESQLNRMRPKEGTDIENIFSPEGEVDWSQFEPYNPLQGILEEGGDAQSQFRLKGITTDETGNLKYNIEPIQTEEDFLAKARRKAQEQAITATEKEKQLNISKVSRLSNIADIVEKKFLETEPYSTEFGGGFVTKTGITPLLGIVDVAKSQLQATEAQRNDLAYRKFIKGMRAQLARAMGDVGNLSEPEQKAAMELVPTLLDSKETGLKKLDNLRDFIATIQATSERNINQSENFATEGLTGNILIDRQNQPATFSGQSIGLPTPEEAIAELKRRGRL